MKKIIEKSLLASLLFFCPALKADDLIRLMTPWNDALTIQGVDLNTGQVTDLATYSTPDVHIKNLQGVFTDEYQGKYYMSAETHTCDASCVSSGNTNIEKYWLVFDFETKTIEKVTDFPWDQTFTREYFSGTATSEVSHKDISPIPSSIRSLIKKNSDGNIQIGSDENPLIAKKSNGEIHIGKNSWITKEENGRQKVYAKDAAGNPIPIDYTNGTKLLINGRDVEQSINNVGALSAALTGLPTVPADTTLACGLGTGTHGGNIAFSGGCASKVNDKLSINYAASMNIPSQDYAGDFEDQFSARAGFIWKLGKATQPNLISMKENQKLTNEITDLKSENKKLNKKITKFITEKSELLARLERLEKIALSKTNSRDLATIKLP